MQLRKILFLAAICFFFLFAFFAEFVVSYLLPFPLSTTNMLVVSLLLFLLWKEQGIVVWLSFAMHFFLEFLTTTPFGIQIFSGTAAFLIMYWLIRSVFISRSWYMAPIFTVMTLLLYRLLEFITLVGARTFANVGIPPLQTIGMSFLAELVSTSLVTTGVYFFMLFISRRLNTRVVFRGRI